MLRTAFTAAIALAMLCGTQHDLLAQTQSIEDAPGYRTVPESSSPTPEGGVTFGDSTLVIQAPSTTSGAATTGSQGSVQAPGTQATIQAVPPVNFTPRQVSAFAETAVQVQTVAQLWQPVINDAISSDEAANLTQQANAEKIRAIEDLGLIPPETYAQINEAARRDPKLRTQIEELYEAAARRLPRGGAS